jgi:hypothetical protein
LVDIGRILGLGWRLGFIGGIYFVTEDGLDVVEEGVEAGYIMCFCEMAAQGWEESGELLLLLWVFRRNTCSWSAYY